MDRSATVPVFTAANLLTLSRLPMALLFWLAPSNATFILVVVFVAGLSDVVDGRVARAMRRRQARRGDDPVRIKRAAAVGAWLDPLCDKLFVISALAAIYVGFQPPVAILLLVAARELILTPMLVGYWLSRGKRATLRFDFRASSLGKATTASQFAAIATILYLPALTPVLAGVAAVIGVAAAVSYLARALEALH